jgi:uncharacterized protein YeaO (DUF488 family)
MIRIKRIYESPKASPGDGRRILVDRLWPRGLRKNEVVIDEWLKDLAPSTTLRKWFGHDPERWQEFELRYREELKEKSGVLKKIRDEGKRGDVTILYAAKDAKHNNAVVVKEMVS